MLCKQKYCWRIKNIARKMFRHCWLLGQPCCMAATWMHVLGRASIFVKILKVPASYLVRGFFEVPARIAEKRALLRLAFCPCVRWICSPSLELYRNSNFIKPWNYYAFLDILGKEENEHVFKTFPVLRPFFSVFFRHFFALWHYYTIYLFLILKKI